MAVLSVRSIVRTQCLLVMMAPEGSVGTQSLAAEASETALELRNPLLWRIRYQLGGALAIGLLLPLVLRWPVETLQLNVITDVWRYNSSIGAAAAISLGYGVLRQFIVFPGAKATAYILPSLTVSFAIVALLFFLWRIEYSRYLFVASYTLSVSWLYAVFFLCNRYAAPRLGLVPGGDHHSITDISGAEWHPLSSATGSLAHIDAVVADLNHVADPAWERLVARCILAGIPVYDVRNVIESMTGRAEFVHLSESSFGSVLPSKVYIRFKRLIDLALSAILIPPIMLAIAAAAITIRFDTPGPVFFTQSRMGYRGKAFNLYKLRSMRSDMPQSQHFTVENDPRITRVGKFIRKYHIDELPQVLNIIKGDMSWIGPRPEAIALAEWYAKDIPLYIYRHAVRPGVSGWAQVHQGNVAEIDAAKVKLQYDFFYIKNFSPWLDLLIVLKTIRTILFGLGSK